MTFGEGGAINISRKQKLNTKSSTESELVGADDASVMILWTKLFMEHQGYEVKENILFQDNQSTILLESVRVHSTFDTFFSQIKLRKETLLYSIVLQMKCGATSTANPSKARSSDASVPISWANKYSARGSSQEVHFGEV